MKNYVKHAKIQEKCRKDGENQKQNRKYDYFKNKRGEK